MTAKAYQEDDPYLAQRVYSWRVRSKEEDEALLREEEFWEDLNLVVDLDSPEAAAVRAEARGQLQQLIAGLSGDEPEIVRRRFLEDDSPAQIANDLQLTRERLLDLRGKALYRLKRGLRANGISPEDFKAPDPEA